MHATRPTLLGFLSLAAGLALSLSCGGQPPTVCSACQYGTATYSVNAQQLQGGTIVAATMHTEVDHTSCPYGGSTAACTATLDINVLCRTPGAGGPYAIERRPNGLVHGSTDQASTVNLVVKLPSGNITVPVLVQFVPGSSSTAVSPCGGSVTPTITY
jgi:hypothetical protein